MTYNQKTHKELMLAVLAKIQDKPLVLKGGTSLMLCYGLDRFSEDLDFDIQGDFAGKGTINLENTLKSVKGRNFEILDVITKKDTPTVTRYMLRYHDKRENQNVSLKIETSYRTPNHDYDVIHGIKTAKIHDIAEFKINSVLDTENNSRTKARDLYDANFIIREYVANIPLDSLRQLAHLDIDTLSARYNSAFLEDSLLSEKTDADSVILELQQNAQKEFDRKIDGSMTAAKRDDFKQDFEENKAKLSENDKVKVEAVRRVLDFLHKDNPTELQTGYEKLTTAMKNGEISKLPDVPQQVVQQSVDISLPNNSGKDKER